MKDAHVEELLVAHARGELGGDERARVEAHLPGCAACRGALQGYARILAELARTAPPAPPMHWGAYRAELRDKLERRTARSGARWSRVVRPAPALVAAGLLAALIYAGLPGSGRGPGGPDLLAADDPVLGSRLDMIDRLEVVRQLDLLEDFNVIVELDHLTGPGKS